MNNDPNKKKITRVHPIAYIVSLVVVALLSVGFTLLATNASVSSPAETESSSSIESSQSAAQTESEDTSTSNIDYTKFEQVYNTLMSQYFQEVSSEDLMEGALSGMTSAVGDPYTEYLDLSDSAYLNESIDASFEGIGAEVQKQGDYIMIVSPIAGSPAEKAGLMPNDIILKADDKELSGLSLNEAVSYIRGEKGSEVVLTIQRGDNTFEVTLTRDTIPVETVVYNLDESDPTVGYVAITSFSTPTYEELVAAIEELRSQGATSFIFDVRQNPGGLLDGAINISNMFLEDGDTIVQTQERDQEPISVVADDVSMGEFQVTEPSVLLVDEGSASASEILAGALQESADISIVGSTTFGKGTVQSVIPFADESELKLTIAKWLTPSGNWIHDKGIEPDIVVELPDYAYLLMINSADTYQEGDTSEEVENLEKVIDALNYEVGEVDGYFDETTAQAVESFQADQDLTVDGVVTEETAIMLITELRNLIDSNDTQYKEALNYLQQ
ncbi:S41 family peptidase [Desemzia sp. RIT804]|uniref:S41 family peptidase n=1 Tax=Desemzia sp. RIT 804 TaxID=2810209 RepID=UPI00194EDF2C|nr:S41 family peptidase [Desemzia sp. RIT 804]MBM6613755.1 S41 family peptidase [Desemzia sp. RIT 804]